MTKYDPTFIPKIIHINTRRPWTPSAVKVLKIASKKDTPVRYVARVLKRSAGAVRQKAMTLGLSMGGGRGRKRA